MSNIANKILLAGNGILRMVPNWVPRSFCVPGRRLRLHPDDLYAYGAQRGGIDERWFASCEKASNGPLTTEFEGLSFVAVNDSGTEKILFRDLVQDLGAGLLGDAMWTEYQSWPVFAKFFDNQGALPHHLHHRKTHAEKVSARPKPEAYFFPVQMNNHLGDFPYTFFGLEPGTTIEDVKDCLRRWDQGENGILSISKAYKLELGTGWNVPAGILHAPGSLCTYEPQWSSDIAAMFQSLVNNRPTSWNSLVGYVPEEQKQDLDYITELIDFPANVDPDFRRNHFLRPIPVPANANMQGMTDQWIVYGAGLFASKETTIHPGATVVMQDPGAYSLIAVQGYGKLANYAIESPTLIRFGQQTNDEFFVSAPAAKAGVAVQNLSPNQPLVLLKTFGPGIVTP